MARRVQYLFLRQKTPSPSCYLRRTSERTSHTRHNDLIFGTHKHLHPTIKSLLHELASASTTSYPGYFMSRHGSRSGSLRPAIKSPGYSTTPGKPGSRSSSQASFSQRRFVARTFYVRAFSLPFQRIDQRLGGLCIEIITPVGDLAVLEFKNTQNWQVHLDTPFRPFF